MLESPVVLRLTGERGRLAAMAGRCRVFRLLVVCRSHDEPRVLLNERLSRGLAGPATLVANCATEY